MIGRRRTLRDRTDTGTVLVLALLMITTVAVVTGAVLTRGGGSLRATIAFRDVAQSSYAADAAAQIAINDLRTGYNIGTGEPSDWYFTNADAEGCFGYDGAAPSKIAKTTLQLSSSQLVQGSGGLPVSAAVVCTPENATGEQGSAVPITAANKPGYALVTLDGPLTSEDTLTVRGGVYSNSSILGPVAVESGGVTAFGPCLQVTGTPKRCNTRQRIADPGVTAPAAYASDLGSTVPALQTPPTSCVDDVAIFTPGYYDDAEKLNEATEECDLAWFKPGTYYFDFHNNGCANVCPDNLYGKSPSESKNVWTIEGTKLIAGTWSGADGNTNTPPPSSQTIPGGCESPITNTSAQGVQFVFGGSSRMYLDNFSQVEICGSYRSNRPPITFYGLKTGATPTETTTTGLTATSVATGGFTGATPAALAATGGAKATWKSTTSSAATATLTLNGFAPPTPVPAGAVLTGATVRVVHQDADSSSNSAASFSLQVGSTTIQDVDVDVETSLKSTSIPLSATDLATLQTEVHDNGFSSAKITYTAAAKKKDATTTVDALTLDLKYYLPVLRGQSGTCVATTTALVQTCPLVDMPGGNNKVLLYFQGTVYAPLSFFDLLLGNFSAQVARFGMVVRELKFAITNGNPSFTGPIIEIPDDTPGFGTETTLVRLDVYLCRGLASGCTPGAGTQVLEARVNSFDPGADASKRQMSVLSWNHLR